MPASDRDMLEALLEDPDRLGPNEENAFLDMLDRLCRGQQIGLTPAQRDWVERRYKRLELDAEEGAQNWVSSGKVEKTNVVLPYENLPRPKGPPGRSSS